MLKQSFLSPLAAPINFFSIPGLLILAGLLNYGNLAADIAVIQGAILAVFHSLSANAHNLILASGSSQADEKNLFYFRILISLPTIFAVYFLTNTAIEIPIYLFTGLVLRKCCEWLAELQLANRKVQGDFDFARRYVWLNSTGFGLLVASLVFSPFSESFMLVLFAWAVLPTIQCASYLRFVFGLRQSRLRLAELIPHYWKPLPVAFPWRAGQ